MLKIEEFNNLKIVKAIFENSYNSIVITDAQLDYPGPVFLYVNKAFMDMTGYTLDELEGKTPRILQGERTDRKTLDRLKKELKEGKCFWGKAINYKKNKEPYHVEWNIYPITNHSGETIQYISIQKDTTVDVQHQLFLKAILDRLNDIVVLTDGNKLVYVNKKFELFFKVISLDEYLKESNCICEKFESIKGYYYKKTDNEDWINSLLKLPVSERMVTILDQNNIKNVFSVDIESFDESKSVITFSNITEVLKEKEQYKNKANHDNLTQAYNREYLNNNFERLLGNAQRNNKNMGVLLFDIDNFKSINDSYGHNTGDMVLKSITNITIASIRIQDVLIRWGGEEFVILVEVDNLMQLEKITQTVRIRIENYDFSPVPKVTASFGITILNKNESLHDLIGRADKGLYKAKNTGKNCVCSL